ncbi:hypothetical protein H696_01292 [Fonticula alba]|uniref:Glycosyltransferase subfamily 4-like N-terminal domain-containing protein n=1 Tax=Fonticula alba TaxID=691883 RepID=A0A058ZD75_FONAL|nr:hypothetical protein H696_01292 [Fonticula alba]KCV71883.1 hypothetical protein H696_01292 [Fonticula alba]|eukprot:XP_009493461.1 hypothetical protein H696_01292 [Fonticula alba]
MASSPPGLRAAGTAVLVLGDIDRSPRMCLHAESLARRAEHLAAHTSARAPVFLIGYTSDALRGKLLSPAPIPGAQCPAVGCKHAPWDLACARQASAQQAGREALLPAGLARHQCVRLVPLQRPGSRLLGQGPAHPVALAWRALRRLAGQWLMIVWLLCFSLQHLEAVVVQTPPAIPTLMALAAARMVLRLRRVARSLAGLPDRAPTRMLVDWHNYAFTLMGRPTADGSLTTAVATTRRTGESRLIVLARYVERQFGRWAGDRHLAVTESMARDLGAALGRPAGPIHVLYDWPGVTFGRVWWHSLHTCCEGACDRAAGGPQGACPMHRQRMLRAHGLLASLQAEHLGRHAWARDCPPEATLWTVRTPAGVVQERQGRPLIAVSSSSWTPDEDMGLLLRCLVLLDQQLATPPGGAAKRRRLVLFMTGRGPLQGPFVEALARVSLVHVAVVCTSWMAFDQYATLLGTADFGLSMHVSSSGRDYPMKLVDMAGAALPAVSIGFPAVAERLFDPAATDAAGESGQGPGHMAGLVAWPLGLGPFADMPAPSFTEPAHGGLQENPLQRLAHAREHLATQLATCVESLMGTDDRLRRLSDAALELRYGRAVAGESIRLPRLLTWEESWQATVLPLLEG